MARLSRFVTVVVLLGGATVSLSACTGGSDPIASPSPSVSTVVTPSPSPSASPSPTALTDEELLALIPEEARAENFGSASNFAKFFIDQYPTLFHTGHDGELFQYLSADDCVFCANAITDSVATGAAGAYNEGGTFTWPDQPPRGGLESDGYWYVTQGFEVSDTITYLEDGSQYKTERGGAGEVGLKMAFDEGGWRVHGVEFVYDDE